MAKKRVSRRQFLGFAGAAALTQVLGKPASAQAPSPQEIISVSIHPAIGVARVGNSQLPNFSSNGGRLLANGAFIGPEVIQPDLFDPNFPATPALRDVSGAIRRQAARFRIYGKNRLGQVRELTANEADIKWSVHLANKKSQWYQFIAALDLPVPQGEKMDSLISPRRNPTIVGDRSGLAIDAGLKSITGKLQQGESLTGVFSRGVLPNRQPRRTSVPLGQLATDELGRLVVVGGHGRAGSPEGLSIFDPSPGKENTFNNADGWFDDISDGPVTATVTVRGQAVPLEAAPAWVFVAPPNFAPNVIGWRTLYDLVSAVPVVDPVTQRVPPAPTQTSFRDDVLPLLARLSGHQWVNHGFGNAFGKSVKKKEDSKDANKPVFDFTDPNLLKRLSDRSETALRREVFELFRMQGIDPVDKRKDLKEKDLWPMIYGDAFGTFKNTPDENLKVPDRAAFHLQNWVRGNYIDDIATRKRLVRVVEELQAHEQPAMLDRAALEYCLADAFHPGCEVTWPMRHPSLYMAPGRIKHRVGPGGDDFGATLTPSSVLQAGGPLEGQVPGGLTRWMALPWHGDTAFCRSGYEPEFHPLIPTFWAARVPNHVLTEANYNIVVNRDPRITREQRLAAYQERAHWLRALQGAPDQQMIQMVNGFSLMGIVEARPGLLNDQDFPPIMYVESLPAARVAAEAARANAEAVATSARAGTRGAPRATAEDDFKKAGWRDKKQRDDFRRLKGPK